MANSKWTIAYPSGRSEYLRFEGSDHRPLVSSFDPVRKRRKGLFRYDRRLRHIPEVKKLICDTWNACPDAGSTRRGKSPQALLDDLNRKLTIAYQKEEEIWKQRSRQLWLALGDKNFGFFHAATKSRKAINNISVLESEQGDAIYEEQEIVDTISSYYQELFTSTARTRSTTVRDALTPCITEAMNEELLKIPSPTEVKNACFDIHPDKVPGPDGFSASFYQPNWDTLSGKVTTEIQDFFTSGSLPAHSNHTHVRLIPNITSPKRVADYRPIALCSIFYKIIAKIISKRLQSILQTCISQNQSAFVPGRAITDNVLITHEALHYLKQSMAQERVYLAVKTDMSKAYERLEWSFIEEVLTRMGFHPHWTNIFMQCITSVSYSYLLNGQAKGMVKPSRGIRQGDPLSPYIFILCSEVLSGLCNKAQVHGKLHGIRVAKGSPRVNHLLFADDTMFFCKSDKTCVRQLKEILHKYEAASGQKINQDKSSITFSRKTKNDIKERVKQELGINKTGGQGKYLGLPELFGRKKKDLFTMIVDRIKQRALSWSSKFLSSTGKLTLLKSVLGAMPSYTMSCFKLPNSLCSRIQSALTRFWWDEKPDKRKMCWIAWDKMTKSFKDSGLGFRDLQCYNDALLAKISWRILTQPSCLLAKVLTGKYYKTTSFLESPVPNHASHGWRSICLGRELLKTDLSKLLGTGEATPIWGTPWLSLDQPFSPLGPPQKEDQHLRVADLLLTQSKEWNIPLIKRILPFYEENILNPKPSKQGGSDSWAWLPTPDGIYSAKSGYYEALQQKKHVPFKDRFNTELTLSFKTGLVESTKIICLPPTGIATGPLAPWIIWTRWTARNRLLFDKTQIQTTEIISLAILRAKEWQEAQQTQSNRTPVQPRSLILGQRSIQPFENPITCFTDAVWQVNGNTGCGWIFKDQSGDILLQGESTATHIRSPLMAEALATLTVLGVAIESGFNKISFASNSQMLVQALNRKTSPKELCGLLYDSHSLSDRFDLCSFSHISRLDNFQADALAKHALKDICNCN
ncbi:PREDICTED: uncharacterized protein LOC104727990 [Camelina sativa]|uniref:Uncharacterized protein LOC104727990 n=1 Tax=Camelina sativa TaxID=90675 RepID=A0ABM0US43_CAMSA|nr:PREDICTED: uncharacterized protein LOC104727990 [Camelina sativa]